MGLMYRLTFLGPALEMHAGGLAWKQGESHDFDDKHTARRMMTRYRYAVWSLEEVEPEPKPSPKPAPSRRQGRKKIEPKPEAEAESEPPQLAEPLAAESPSPSEEEE